jgi:hypothetical protein
MTRNLRIREDQANYLLNLDTNSAYFDPKSRYNFIKNIFLDHYVIIQILIFLMKNKHLKVLMLLRILVIL